MENYSTTSSFDSFELQVSTEAQGYLKTAANWGIFLAVVAFIILGIGLIFSFSIIAAGSMVPQNSGLPFALPFTAIGIISIAFNVVGGIPAALLFRFASKVKRAIDEVNTQLMTDALKNLKSHFMFVGIYVILGIVTYIGMIAYFISLAAEASGRF